MKAGKRIPKPARIGAATLGAVLAFAFLLAFLTGAYPQAAPLCRAVANPRIQAITVTSNLPISDTHLGDGVTKTVYFNNVVSGVITLTFEISGTPTLTLTAGAAFGFPEQVFTSSTPTWRPVVAYSVGTGSGDYPGVAYTAINTSGVQTTIAITYVRDVTAPVAGIVSPPADYFTGTQLVVTGTATDDGGAGVRRIQVMTNTIWVTAAGTANWAYTTTVPITDGRLYTLSARAEDYLGIIQSPATTRVISVDNVRPANPALITTTNGTVTGTWMPTSTVPVTWNLVTDGSGVTYYYTWTTTSTTAVGAGALFTTTPPVTGTNLSEGDNWFHLRTRDGAGNWTTDTLHLGPFKVDTVPPAVAISMPASGAVLTTVLSSTLITGTAEDTMSGVSVVEVTTGTVWVTAVGTDTWGYTWSLPVADDVVYTLTARAIDAAGLGSASDSVTVTVDTVAPTATVPTPDRGPWMTSTVVYTWPDSNDGAGIAGYQVNITNTEGYSDVFPVPSAIFTFTRAYSEGVGYYAHVLARDNNGNIGVWSGPSTVVTPDLMIPSVMTPSIDTQESKYLYAVGTTLYYTNHKDTPQSFYVKGYSLDELSGVDMVTFSPAFGESPDNDISGFWPWSPAWPGYGVDPYTTTVGIITATVYDKAGNTAIQTYTYDLDGAPPYTGSAVINSGATYVTQTEVTLALSADDAGCGVADTCINNTGAACTAWESYITPRPWTLEGADGAKTIYVWFGDHLGNVSGPCTDTTILDRQPPTNVTITAPEHISATQFLVSWSAQDATSGVATYTVAYSGTAYTSWQDWLTNTTALSETFTALATDTDYIFRVTAYDRAGNSAEGMATTHVGPFRVYLPLTLRGWVWWYQYDVYEPNDTPAQAWGALKADVVYEAYIWDATDKEDYYHFTPSTYTAVHIELTNIPSNCDYDLYVYYYDGQYQLVALSNQSGNTPENVTFTPVAEWKYFVRVYPYSGFSSQQPYYLKATYQ